MSEKKRGFLGRLFGSRPDDADRAESPVAVGGDEAAAGEVPALDTADIPTSGSAPDVLAFDAAPDLVEPLGSPDLPEATPPADLGPQEDVAPPELDPVPEPEPEAVSAPDPAAAPRLSWFGRLKQGLSRSSSALTEGISSIFTKRRLDAAMLDELEDVLIQADLGVDTATAITERLSVGRFDKEISAEEVRAVLAEEVEKVLAPVARPLDLDGEHRPHVVLMVGVNGTGKTTTIGKLSSKLAAEGRTVMLAAGDTFRAAAVEQLKIWGSRTGAEVVARDTGADAAGLAFDALQAARDKGVDVLLVDTAGRLQNKAELMAELEKVIRVLRKIDPAAPHTVLLTLDATTGQNALSQVEIFGRTAGVTGLVMTKLDGTARGGILVAIAAKYGLPVHFIGVGEGVDDLEPFSAKDYARAIAGLA
ncbi:signal recognition particle-docking protein FtsY [Polymorphum gilvum]|uniref:Signal recognition particle receptor FtsY n=1 Tax=Polymorphum gilvum (strain LMG 25793 / CGMCC 1.9160 / SL003B-26A1) TaxID=991905 RepID=F2IZH6_POLGS|nr:signal recognition particle-docking protein FtsY [Polymorphum gilvum]ADZ68599.1 Cell division transporter substrate-binding protein FtsY (Signal recognition particle receptor) [Polymorphum gilvum SL003B-26A1]